MQSLLLGMLLDEGGRELARALAAVLVGLLLVLLVAAIIPMALVAGAVSAPPRTVAQLAGGFDVLPAVGPPRATGQTVPGQTVLADSRAVEVAERYLGVRYVFGGTDPATGLDCSGLVQLVFRQLGVGLPRTAQLQYDATPRVSRDELNPGDLVFFSQTYADPHDWITHVGIYVGGGMQINAPTEGQVVSISPVFSGFWGAHYAGAGRVKD
jgi:cell wall-associated NlpC family hydrolase